MKTKGQSSKFWKHKAGAVGIGTLIVFIAMILVAAVAAVVLIRTSGVLEQRAYEVGTSATSEASNKIKLTSVIGLTDGTNVTELIVTIVPAGGSDPIDLQKTKMFFMDATTYVSGIEYNNSAAATDKAFTLTSLQGDADAVLEVTENDIVELHYQLGDGSVRYEIPEDTTFSISLVPMKGAPTELTITTPASLDDTYVALYP